MDLSRTNIVLWGLLFVLTSANSQGRPKAEVTLEAKATLEATALVVSYQVTNGTEQPIVLWDRMLDYNDQGEKVHAEAAYVFWQEPDAVRLVRAQLQTPPGVDIYRKEIPYARTVAPHASVQGVVRLPLPLQEASPFYSPPDFWKVVDCGKVHLLIGWREVLPGMKVTAVTLQGVAVELVGGKWQAPAQRLLETAFALPVRLKVRTDAFDRSMPMR